MKNSKNTPLKFYLLIILFIISIFSSLFLLYPRLIILVNGAANPGMIFSIILLFIYLFLLIKSIYLFLKLKKEAINTSTFAVLTGITITLWVYLLGPLILAENKIRLVLFLKYLPTLLINLFINILILIYLKKSKEIKGILINK